MTQPPLWDAAVLARIRHLHLRARGFTEAVLLGEHRSRRVGQTVEFLDYQEYAPGMDLRRLDWRVMARTDRAVVRRYVAETELPCTIILDLSGDLGTGEAGRAMLPDLEHTKAGFAIVYAATLMYFLQRHGEPVGLEIVAGTSRWTSLPPRKGRSALQQAFLALADARPKGTAQLNDALTRVGGRTKRRSWVCLISDGMEEPREWLPSLAAFGRRGCELSMIHLYDRSEWGLSLKQPSIFFSPEGGEEFAVDPHGARKAFEEVVSEYRQEVREGVVRAGGRYLLSATDIPMENSLRELLIGNSVAVEVG